MLLWKSDMLRCQKKRQMQGVCSPGLVGRVRSVTGSEHYRIKLKRYMWKLKLSSSLLTSIFGSCIHCDSLSWSITTKQLS